MIGILLCLAEVPGATEHLSAGQEKENSTGSATVAISREGAQVIITFTGTLQAADALGASWNDVPNAASPFNDNPVNAQRFYRTRGPDSIFSSHAVVPLTMIGPFQTNFDLAFAGTPDGIFPPRREKPYFDATLKMTGYELPVSARVRGNSSLQECPFPKLKFKVSKERRAGTPFFDAREVKIGTHCAEGGRGNIGRLRDETAAYREALAYETMSVLGFITPRVRRASIDYRDITPANGSSTVGWQLTRDALILDDIEVVAGKLGGHALSDEEIAALTDPGFDEQLITDLQLLHALLGNWDYSVSLDGRGLWNTDVIEFQSGKLVPVAGDFDLCSWVTEVVRLSAPREYHPELADVERQARYEVEQIQQRVSGPSFAAGSDRFVLQRAALESQIAVAEVDEAGRANAFRHVTAFFDALSSVTR